jgi:hypothetical protein
MGGNLHQMDKHIDSNIIEGQITGLSRTVGARANVYVFDNTGLVVEVVETQSDGVVMVLGALFVHR